MATYCISDIHGQYINFKRFVDSLNKDDRVFVLGDIIDRGPEPIKILKEVMKDKRFRMLLGNHEYMMYQYLCANNKDDKDDAYNHWAIRNGGQITLDQYSSLSKYYQKKIIDYIINLPLVIPNLEINNRKFYLVHSDYSLDNEVNMKDINFDYDIIAKHVWQRFISFNEIKEKGITVIAGHTYVQHHTNDYEHTIKPLFDLNNENIKDIKDAYYIDIDGGLAGNFKNAKLIALCLDDLSYSLY